MPTDEPPAAPPAAPAADPPPAWDSSVWDPETPGRLVDDWHAKAPNADKLGHYAKARSLAEVIDAAESRVSAAQTALRNKAPSGLPARPADDAPPEYWKAYRDAHGLPGAPDGYNNQKPPSLPDELWDANKVKSFSEFAHKHDIKPEQYSAVLEWFHSDLQNGYATQQAAQAEQARTIKEQESAFLTTNFGAKLDSTLADLQAVAQASGLPASSFDPNAPDYWGVTATKLFADLVARIPRGEDGTARHMGSPSANGQFDLAWAKATNNPSHPDYKAWTTPSHPRYEEVTRLRNQAYALGGQSK